MTDPPRPTRPVPDRGATDVPWAIPSRPETTGGSRGPRGASRGWLVVALTALGGYLLWNAWWLGHRQVPPSVFTWATGLPCPTTGGTRAMQALRHGEILASLHHNALAVPLAMLWLATLGRVGWLAILGRPIRLGRAWAWAWGVCLLLAWVMKLLPWV